MSVSSACYSFSSCKVFTVCVRVDTEWWHTHRITEANTQPTRGVTVLKAGSELEERHVAAIGGELDQRPSSPATQ